MVLGYVFLSLLLVMENSETLCPYPFLISKWIAWIARE